MGETSDRCEIPPDPVALASRVAEWMKVAALAAKGTFRMSLSGGSTPKTLYQLLTPAVTIIWLYSDAGSNAIHPRFDVS